MCFNHLGEQPNKDVPKSELKTYGIRQALFFSCCTDFKNSFMYLPNILTVLEKAFVDIFTF